MRTHSENLVIVGFQADGTFRADTSELIAARLHHQRIGAYSVESIVWPAIMPREDDDRGYRVLKQASEHCAHPIICIGMDPSSRGFKVENQTVNRITSTAATPGSQEKPISWEYGQGERLSLDLRRWNLTAFQCECAKPPIELPVTQSNDPGGSYFNHFMWQMEAAYTAHFVRFCSMSWICMQLPCCPETLTSDQENQLDKTVVPLERLEAGVRKIIELTHF